MLYVRQLIIVTAFLCGTLASFLAQACELEIHVNDPRSTISVDDVVKGAAPLRLPCLDRTQRVLIEAPYRESFYRVVPSKGEGGLGPIVWDVQLKYAQDVAQSKNLTISQVNVSAVAQTDVLEEIKQLRAMIDELRHAQMASQGKTNAAVDVQVPVRMPASDEQVLASGITSRSMTIADADEPADSGPSVTLLPKKAKAKTQAAIEAEEPESVGAQSVALPVKDESNVEEANAVTAPIQVVGDEVPAEAAAAPVEPAVAAHGGKKLKGTFVQLHALLENAFNEGEAMQEIAAVKASLGHSLMNLCKTAVDNSGRSWTKIFLGPFKNRKVAEKIAAGVGRGTFLVRNPECVNQPDTKSIAGEQ